MQGLEGLRSQSGVRIVTGISVGWFRESNAEWIHPLSHGVPTCKILINDESWLTNCMSPPKGNRGSREKRCD